LNVVILNAVKDLVRNEWVNNRFFASLRMTCEDEWRVRVTRKKGIVILNAVKDLVRNDWVNNSFFASLRMTGEDEWRV